MRNVFTTYFTTYYWPVILFNESAHEEIECAQNNYVAAPVLFTSMDVREHFLRGSWQSSDPDLKSQLISFGAIRPQRYSIDRVYKNWYRVWDTQSAPKCRLPLLETVDLRQRQYASNILFLYVPTCSAWFNVSMFHLSLTGARIGPSLADPHFLIVSSVSSALAYALCYATKAMSDLAKWQ